MLIPPVPPSTNLIISTGIQTAHPPSLPPQRVRVNPGALFRRRPPAPLHHHLSHALTRKATPRAPLSSCREQFSPALLHSSWIRRVAARAALENASSGMAGKNHGQGASLWTLLHAAFVWNAIVQLQMQTPLASHRQLLHNPKQTILL